MDFIGIQELGGQGDLLPPWQNLTATLDGLWNFYTAKPPLAFRAVSIGIPESLFPQVEKVTNLSCGICLTLKQYSARTFVISAHLPHKQRSDCIETWQTFQSQLDVILQRRRLHDTVIILHDTNYELGAVEDMSHPNSSDERGFLARSIMQQHNLLCSKPSTSTWSNTRGSTSKIDFILVSTPTEELVRDVVHVDSDFLLGCDRRAVSIAFKQVGPRLSQSSRTTRSRNKCGQWKVDGAKALPAFEALAERLELGKQDFKISDLEKVSQQVSYRPKSYRYKDPPQILDMIKQRRSLIGREARNLCKDILRLRAKAKVDWLTGLLNKGSQGDFGAIAYFKRRQNVLTTHNNYIARAGGTEKATQDLKLFYRLKYTPPDPPMQTDFSLSLYHSRVGLFPKPALISEHEIIEALATTKSGKSSGQDGISYEFLTSLMHSQLAPHLADLFNSILFQVTDIPDSWLISKLTFIPKIKTPSRPKDLRPIVLWSTPAKIFTKILLMRLRPSFPPISGNQIACIPGSQTLDGSVCLQHLIHLSQEYKLPLVAIKLDVSSAFDHLSHDAVASFLALSGARLEALTLLKIIVLSKVALGIAGVSWQQKLFRGLLQGSSYSAEIFGRTLDYFLGFLHTRWSISQNTWIQSRGPDGSLIQLFADDIILLATSYAQARTLLEGVVDILASIGLTLALDKCKFIVSPDLPSRPLRVRHIDILPVRSFTFLGVLMGFDINSQTILAARLSMTNNAFWGYYKILRRPGAPIRKRLHLLNTYVTSKWRWMSPCVRSVTAVHNMLSVMHNTLLTSLCGLRSDPFVTASSNWVVRRRASKMCAQVLSHQSWAGVHALSFMIFGSTNTGKLTGVHWASGQIHIVSFNVHGMNLGV